MLEGSGWTKAYNKSSGHPIIMRDAEHLAVWMFLLLNATHDDKRVWFGGRLCLLKAGQLIVRTQKIADELQVHRSKVVRILTLFMQVGLLVKKGYNRGTFVSIVDWAASHTLEVLALATATEGESRASAGSQAQLSCSSSQGGLSATPPPHVQAKEYTSDKYYTPTPASTSTAAQSPINTSNTAHSSSGNLQQGQMVTSAKHPATIAGVQPLESRFVSPSLQEVRNFIQQEKLNVDATRFWSYYESRGWTVGGRNGDYLMRSWQQQVKLWHARELVEQKNKPLGTYGDGYRMGGVTYRSNRYRHSDTPIHINEMWEKRIAEREAARKEKSVV